MKTQPSCDGHRRYICKTSWILHSLERFRNWGGIGWEPCMDIIDSSKQRCCEKCLEAIMMYFNAIAKVISDRTGCDISAVKPESTFTELGIDSLDTVELLMNLEDELGMEIELGDQVVKTVDDLDKLIRSKQG